MKEQLTVGYKSPLVKTIFVSVGILLIGVVSWMVLQFTWLGLLLSIGLGYRYWSWSRALLRIRYYFSPKEIRITLPNRKEITVMRSDIVSIKNIEKSPLWTKGLGVFVDNDIWYCITSWDHLVELTTKEKIIVISPRILPVL